MLVCSRTSEENDKEAREEMEGNQSGCVSESH